MSQGASLSNAIGATGPKLAARGDSLAERLDLTVTDRIASVKDDWDALDKESNSTVYQRYEWVRASLETLDMGEKRSAFVVCGRLDGKPAFLLPLAISGGFVSCLTWAGGNHSNFNIGLYSQEFLRQVTDEEFALIMDRVLGLIPGFGYMKLCCQPEFWDGARNPMASLPHQRSMNKAFVMDLSGGFNALLARGNAKRKRKKFRSQVKAAEAAGGYRMMIATSLCESEHILQAFLEQKSERLRSQGKTDVFASQHARDFLQKLARISLLQNEPLLKLFALEIGGKIRAVFAAGQKGSGLSGYFSSISHDELTSISPGEMLTWMMAEHCAANGITQIDLGAGDERYKRSWCDQEVELFDVIASNSLFGAPFATAWKAINAAKRHIRENPKLWGAVGTLRKIRTAVKSRLH